MNHKEPEYRRRSRRKALKNQHRAESELQEAAENARVEQVSTAINDVGKKLDRQADENTPQKRAERRWSHAEVFGLWAAAAVGVIAILVASHDAERQRDVMDGQQKAMIAQLAEMQAAGRAWVGPTDALGEGDPQIGKDWKMTIAYQNTGREPAINFFSTVDGFLTTEAEEISGVSNRRLETNNAKCKAIKTVSDTQIVYPSTGFSAVNLGQKLNAKSVNADFVDGKKYLILNGCFAYSTRGKVHHSAWCYFYRHGVSNAAHFNICQIGNYAD